MSPVDGYWALPAGSIAYGDSQVENPDEGGSVITQAIFSSIKLISLPLDLVTIITSDIVAANAGISLDPNFAGLHVTSQDCTGLVLEDLKIVVGANLYVLPSATYAYSDADANDCYILISTADSAYGYPDNAVVLGLPFQAAYDSTFNQDELKVSLNISPRNTSTKVDICLADNTCCEVASPCETPVDPVDPDEKNEGSSDDGLSGGAIAGIISGSILFLIIVSGLSYYCYRKNKTDPAAAYEPVAGSGGNLSEQLNNNSRDY